MAVQINFNQEIANREAYANTFISMSCDTAYGMEVLGVKAGKKAGIATGYVTDGMAQIFYNGKIYLTEIENLSFGNNKTIPENKKAQDILNQLLNNNLDVLTQLNISAEFIEKLSAKGYDVAPYRAKFYQLNQRLINRNAQIKNSQYINSADSQPTMLLSESYLDLAESGIGAFLTPTIITTATVVFLLATMAWYIFYNINVEATADVRESKKLNQLLMNVDSETKEEIFKYINTYGDNRYKAAARKLKIDNLLGNTQNVLLLSAGAFLVFKFVKDK